MATDRQHVNFYLLRGLSREIRHWGHFPQTLVEYSPSFEAYPLELPGAGLLNGLDSPLHTHDYLSELRSQYLRYEQKDTLRILIGFSLGGMIGMDWLSRFPEDFGGLVLINSSSNLSPLLKRMLPTGALKLLRSVITPTLLAKEKVLSKLLCNLADTHELAEQWAEIRRSSPVSLRNSLRQLYAAKTFSLPAGVKAPILNLCSLKDELVSYSCSSDLAKELGSTLMVHDRAGHDLTADDPQWCAEKIINWLNSL